MGWWADAVRLALSAEFVFAQVMADTQGRTAVVVTNPAYPVLRCCSSCCS
ncbi:MAG: hypothetical protein R2746_12525 [Acidimicrobiales bacterium]